MLYVREVSQKITKQTQLRSKSNNTHTTRQIQEDIPSLQVQGYGGLVLRHDCGRGCAGHHSVGHHTRSHDLALLRLAIILARVMLVSGAKGSVSGAVGCAVGRTWLVDPMKVNTL
jgi:hypothetical protein